MPSARDGPQAERERGRRGDWSERRLDSEYSYKRVREAGSTCPFAGFSACSPLCWPDSRPRRCRRGKDGAANGIRFVRLLVTIAVVHGGSATQASGYYGRVFVSSLATLVVDNPAGRGQTHLSCMSTQHLGSEGAHLLRPLTETTSGAGSSG